MMDIDEVGDVISAQRADEPESDDSLIAGAIREHVVKPLMAENGRLAAEMERTRIALADALKAGHEMDMPALIARAADAMREFIAGAVSERKVRDDLCYALWLHAEAVWQRDEAIERAINAKAEAVADQAMLKGMTVEDGAAVLELGPPRELVIAWVDAARKMLGDAPNYTETRMDFPRESFSMEVKAAGEFDRYVFTVQRAGKRTPHEARLEAEAERDEARTRADENHQIGLRAIGALEGERQNRRTIEAERDQLRGALESAQQQMIRFEQQRDAWKMATMEGAPANAPISTLTGQPCQHDPGSRCVECVDEDEFRPVALGARAETGTETDTESVPQPGDWVTINLHSDGYNRTSEVAADGSYTGCGAVVAGRAHLVSVHRPRAGTEAHDG